MFHNDGFTKLGEDIYVFKNFATQEECSHIVSIVESFSDKAWHEIGEGRTGTAGLVEIDTIKQRIIAMLDKDTYLGKNCSVVRIPAGIGWGEHSDDHDFQENLKKAELYKDGDEFDLLENSIYGLVIYFNNFEGGEIYYPTQNIEYKPQAGDLVIHSSRIHCLHGVRPVKEGLRYSHSNHIWTPIRVPKD